MTDSTILKPDRLNERVTLYLNAEGQPGQRTSREMSIGEVLMAVEWQSVETERLQACKGEVGRDGATGRGRNA
jgi:hypothetical protein